MVVIKNGQLKKGVIDDDALGEGNGKLIDAIERKYGSEVTREFIDRMTRLVLDVVTKKGFSISVADTNISEKAKRKIEKAVEEFETNSEKLVKDFSAGKIEGTVGLTRNVIFENKILQMGGMASNEAGEIVKADLPLNSSGMMAVTGARGSFVNLTQMCAFIGQEALEGERIHRGFTGRTTSHFKRGDIGLKACGYVSHGYKKGLDPFEFFFDAMNSRENLMDKSLHTRHSGYMERRLVNALQDLRVEYDGTVRDSKNHIIQFVAGEDGVDPSKSNAGEVNIEMILE